MSGAPSPALQELLLRRRHKLWLPAAEGTAPPAVLATALANFEFLGFTATPALVDGLRTLPEDELVHLYRTVIPVLRELVGLHVDYVPMYPNFPKQVMLASEAELYLNALLHYFGDWIAERILPNYEAEPRAPLPLRRLDLRVLDLGQESELDTIARELAGANGSISQTDKADLALLLADAGERLLERLPERIPNKENLAFVASRLLDHPIGADVLLTPYFKTATDVLRLAVALSEGDVSLAKPSKFKAFPRKQRRLLLGLIERIEQPEEDVWRRPRMWQRLGERLHPGEHAARYPRAYAAFQSARRGPKPAGFAREAERLLVEDVDAAVAHLSRRPGELARRLDALMVRSEAPARILDRFQAVADTVSTPVLLQLAAHFRHRNEGWAHRPVFPKGLAARAVCLPNMRRPLDEAAARRAVTIAEDALRARFARLPPLGRAWIDPELAELLVPFSQRSASRSLRALVRGSRLPLPPGDTARLFLWWKEGERPDGKPTGRVDVDLSAVLYDADWRYLEHISYTNLRSARYRAAHSGDITSAPNGACEFIDLDLPSVAAFGGRYVVMSALVFSGPAFAQLPECFVGWMARSEPGSGEIFEPRTVVDRVDLTAQSRISVPAILDAVDRRLIWCDLELKARPRWVPNVENNQRSMVDLGRAMVTRVKPSLYELFALHVEARGTRVERREDAELAFALDGDVRPFELERIQSDFMA